MYDRDGKKVLEARPEPPDAAKVSLRRSIHAPRRNSRGWRRCYDGWAIQGFIADSHRIRFARRVLGYALDYRDSPDADKNALRHYSFEKGLLEGLVPLDSISKSRDATLNVNSVGRSFLRCGKDRVSIFFGAAAQYIEVDASNGKLARWNVAIPPIGGGKATGFAVTEAGRSFVNLLSFSEPDNAVTRGLYELRAKTGISAATLVPVDRTLTTHERGGVLPDETLDRLWGADGDELVVHRYEDGWGISWARVLASPSPLSSVIGNLKSI